MDENDHGSPDGKRPAKVGYKNPPEHTRFKKGQASPNPKGRPRGSTKVSQIEKALNRTVTITRGNRRQKVPLPEAITLQLVKQALEKGDVRAAQTLIRVQMDLDKMRARGQISPEEAIEKFKHDQATAERTKTLHELVTGLMEVHEDLLWFGMIEGEGRDMRLLPWVKEAARANGTLCETPRVFPKGTKPEST